MTNLITEVQLKECTESVDVADSIVAELNCRIYRRKFKN